MITLYLFVVSLLFIGVFFYLFICCVKNKRKIRFRELQMTNTDIPISKAVKHVKLTNRE